MNENVLLVGAALLTVLLMLALAVWILLSPREPWPEDYLPELEARDQQRVGLRLHDGR